MAQSAATVQTSKPVPPATPSPQARRKLPTESNFWIRLLPESATYRLPAESTATPAGLNISPPVPLVDPLPAWQFAATVQIPTTPAPSPFTSLPQARSQVPDAA